MIEGENPSKSGPTGGPGAQLWRFFVISLPGKLLILTLVYVLISEAFVFGPSIGRIHRALLNTHVESAEIAILPLIEKDGASLSPALREELLKRVGAKAIHLQGKDGSFHFTIGKPGPIDQTIDLNDTAMLSDIWQGLITLWRDKERRLYVTAPTNIEGAQSIVLLLPDTRIHAALSAYAKREISVAVFGSTVIALLVFTSLFLVLVRPMRRLTRAMIAFRDNPEDASRIIIASNRGDEIGQAERELARMQRDLYGFLQQKNRLAALGAAVARIQHDLRNMLANAKLASDRLEDSDDPVVKRLTPRLVSSLDRAVSLATNTLRYGRVQEPPPDRKSVALAPIVSEVLEGLSASFPSDIKCRNDVDTSLMMNADPDQLFRVILNLVRNSMEALSEIDGERRIRIAAFQRGTETHIHVEDNGPGIPDAIRSRLFEPFATASRTNGSGLGLAIARELVRAHGGDITLSQNNGGATFHIVIPEPKTS